jgi:hypothetical protein
MPDSLYSRQRTEEEKTPSTARTVGLAQRAQDPGEATVAD